MSKRLCSRAPGKIILFGEHFVVKGLPGVGLAVDRHAVACVEPGERTRVVSRQLGLLYDEALGVGSGGNIEAVLSSVRELGCRESFEIVIDSSIHIASGMGSSAAVSVAVAHALLRACGIEPSRELVSKIAYEAEKRVHKRPSGIDNTLATYGGFLYYRSGVFRRLDVMWPEDYVLVIVNTGVKRDTGTVVREVLELYERRSSILEHVYRAAERLVEEAVLFMTKGDIEPLGELMNINHGLLYTINVSCPVCEQYIWLLRGAGALGAKISGAGRGGVVVALFRKRDLERSIESLKRSIGDIQVVRPDTEGVTGLS